jgi:hypothetical protein
VWREAVTGQLAIGDDPFSIELEIERNVLIFPPHRE